MKTFDSWNHRCNYSLLLLLVLLISCREDIDQESLLYSIPEQAFGRDFVKYFGSIAKDHTWSTALKRNLSITLPESSNSLTVYMFSGNPEQPDGVVYKLAEYRNQKGSSTSQLAFDAPEDLDNIYIVVGDADLYTSAYCAPIDSDGTSQVVIDEAPNSYYYLVYSDMQYLLAFEDLSYGIDLDYNDVILGITHICGQTELKVRLWAIGTSANVFALLGNTELYEGRELHEYMGITNNNLVNTFDTGTVFSTATKKASIYSDLRTFPELEESFIVDKDYSLVDRIGDFRLVVSPTINKDDANAKSVSFSQQPGSVPFALLIANPEWEWPSEATNIGVAYTDFSMWVKDPSYYKWYK